MIFIEHASFNDATIEDNFGAPEYSYLFAKKSFRRVLDRLGDRVDVADPARDVDPIFHAAAAKGEPCVFLSYNPPHKTVLGLACPTIPVFAWEYDTIPDETWGADPRNDWRHGLAHTGVALTHCSSSAKAVRSSMGATYPIWVAPSPLFDDFAATTREPRGWRDPFELTVEGGLAISAGGVDLSPFRPERPLAEGHHALRVLGRALAQAGRSVQTLRLEGVVYTSVLAPTDGRKNWLDLLTAFVWAFRRTRTATLVLKLTHAEIEDGLTPVLRHLSTLGDFDCGVVLVHGMLSNEAYRGLIDATSYAVNASYGEGQCLPLMEYMSCGRPAVAPAHSAMLDYVGPENAFVVRSEPQLARWPHDERAAIRCHRQQVSFADLVRQYRESYRVARQEPDAYARMSAAAVRSLRAFCSDEVVTAQIVDMLDWLKFRTADDRRTA